MKKICLNYVIWSWAEAGGWQEKRKAKTLSDLNSPRCTLGKASVLHFELVPCYSNKKIAWFAAKEGSTK